MTVRLIYKQKNNRSLVKVEGGYFFAFLYFEKIFLQNENESILFWNNCDRIRYIEKKGKTEVLPIRGVMSMIIYDISQEVFQCAVFPGDEAPERRVVETIGNGSICNLTALSMCAHNGTHIDAPYHFYKDGKTIDQLDLGRVVGKCFVTFCEGIVTAEMAQEIIDKARIIDPEAAKRILIGADAVVTLEAAQVFVREGILLLGNESQTVGPIEAPAEIHYEFLRAEVVLLEGIRLQGVEEGVYWINAAPLNLGQADGAPCRAILIRE